MAKAGIIKVVPTNQYFIILSGFALLFLSWFPNILATISLAPDGYSCCPIVTVEVINNKIALSLLFKLWSVVDVVTNI